MQTNLYATNSWQEEFRDAIKTSQELSSFLQTPIPAQPYKVFIPRSFASKIKDAGFDSPLWRQFVPSIDENKTTGLHDPIGDMVNAKENGIIHRYNNRILFNPTIICPINCRYCFRKNELEQQHDFLKANLEKLSEYLEDNPQVEEVILTGGDPLILSNLKIEKIIELITKTPSVKFLRFHSRTPIILPSRLDQGLFEVLNKFINRFDAITIAIHVNHSSELSDEFIENIQKFRKFNLVSQSVLLKDVNDCPSSLVRLFKSLNKIGIRPYYLHHPDKAMGAMHFHLSEKKGADIYTSLRADLPGWMIPHYVVDSPLGSGKSLVV